MAAPLTIDIDRAREEPAYEQVARQIREAIATGTLPPGTPLPGVRTLASDLGVNLNTIARAYRQLEDDGFVRIRDRSGVEVVEPSSRGAAGVRGDLQDELWQVLMRLRQSGASLAAMRETFERQLERLPGSGEEGER